MTCIIIEDQPPAQRILKKYIADSQTLQLKATFSNAIQALDFLQSATVDLIFLDIHLPKISGIDFLKAVSNPPAVILTTAFPDYALESYEFNVVDYLLKPFSFARFLKAVSKIPVKNEGDQSHPVKKIVGPKEIFIKSGYEHIKVIVRDILFIKSDGDYTELHTLEKMHLSSESLRHWSEHLDSQQFFRIHKSYIVNIEKIVKFSGNQIHLSDEIILPLGRVYKESFSNRFLG